MSSGCLRTKYTGPVGFSRAGGANSVLLSPRGLWHQLGHWADPTSCLSQSSAWLPCLYLGSVSASIASLFSSLLEGAGQKRHLFGPGIFRSSHAQDLSLTCLILGSRVAGSLPSPHPGTECELLLPPRHLHNSCLSGGIARPRVSQPGKPQHQHPPLQRLR